MSTVPSVSSLCQDMKGEVNETVDQYTEKFLDSQSTGDHSVDKEKVAKNRKENAQDITESFYNLVTDFYEYGYGQSFHFAPLYDGKSFEECIADYERDAGKMLAAKPGMKILVS